MSNCRSEHVNRRSDIIKGGKNGKRTAVCLEVAVVLLLFEWKVSLSLPVGALSLLVIVISGLSLCDVLLSVQPCMRSSIRGELVHPLNGFPLSKPPSKFLRNSRLALRPDRKQTSKNQRVALFVIYCAH